MFHGAIGARFGAAVDILVAQNEVGAKIKKLPHPSSFRNNKNSFKVYLYNFLNMYLKIRIE